MSGLGHENARQSIESINHVRSIGNHELISPKFSQRIRRPLHNQKLLGKNVG